MKTNKLSTRYSNVKQKDGVFTAIDLLDGGREVVIVKSLASLYQRQEIYGKVHWNPVTYRNLTLLTLIETYIRGEKLFTVTEANLLANTYVRYGWLDKNLAQLHWVPLSTIVNMYVNKQLVGADKSKFMWICKLLSLSMREARAAHVIGDIKYNPIKALDVEESNKVAEEVV